MAPVPQPDENEKPNNAGEEVDAVDVPDHVITVDSSDSEVDDGEFGYNGYQMLQQSVGDSDDEDENNLEDVDTGGVTVDADVERSTAVDEASRLSSGLYAAGGNLPSYMKVPDLPRPQPGELLWNQQVQRDIQINPDQSEQIRNTMSNIKLPESNIPPWANDISEDEWKSKLQRMITHSNP
uniref:Male-enhanced antigen 1 n=1 Tax=Crassostrea virginica TaxID=6565 RepID=A0A8B8DQ71_CRAVI|nr:male-enhanced antigen 1-like [Crassostrea virginica]